MRRYLQILALVLLAWRSQAQTNQVIYSNTLQNGWANWSWAAVNLSCTNPVPTGSSYSISVNCSNYTAVYFEHQDFASTPFTNFSFWLNGGASGGQVLSVTGLVNGTNQTVYKLPALSANTWQQFTVSLAAIGVSNKQGFDGLWIWNDNNTIIPTFYLADVVLMGGPTAPVGQNPTNFISVDAAANRHPISPMIYGTAFATSNQLADIGFTMNRSGGNEETTYNWEINAHGKGADYYFESIADTSSTPGESADSVVANAKMGGAQPLITIPMIEWSPILGPNRGKLASFSTNKYGRQVTNDQYFPIAGNGVSITNKTLITWNDKTDAYMPVDTNYQKAYVQHLINTWGASTNGGVRYYIMDNEQSIWFSTHQDIHPVGPTMQEILGKIVAYASMVKSVDPNAMVAGPEEWGWNGYLYSGYDQQWAGQHNDYNRNEYPDRATNSGWDYGPWLLNQLHQYNITNGHRLLDFFTLHCYPQETSVSGDAVDSATELLRNQSTRQFWDSNYVDPSWINSVIMLIPRMSNWVATYYPGTKIGITEYNWGAESSMNGATAQADILGIFGREGVDLATRWTIPATGTPTYLAMKIYRNYDSQHHTFGDTSVLAGGPDPDDVSVFAAQRTIDEALTIMVVNKLLSGATPLVINVTNFIGAGTAQVWQINASSIIAQLPNLPYANGALQTIVPAQSITLLVLPPSSPLTLNLQSGLAAASGQFEFSVNGEIGRRFILQTSPDLTHWTSAGTNTFSGTNDAFQFSAGSSAEFYRAVLLH